MRVLGDYRQSVAYIQQAIALFRELGIKQSLAMATMNLGQLEVLLGEDEQAQTRFCEAIKLELALNARGDIACSLPDFAVLALKAHELERSAYLYAAASALREATEVSITPAQSAEYDSNVDMLRQQMGEAAFKMAWDAGNSMTLEQAVGYALRLDGNSYG